MAVFEHVVLLLRGIVVHVMPAREASCLKGTALLEYRRWGVRGVGAAASVGHAEGRRRRRRRCASIWVVNGTGEKSMIMYLIKRVSQSVIRR